MYSYIKDGVSVSSMIDTRKTNSKGHYPIKIRVNYQRRREYYYLGISITKKEWKALPSSKTTKSKELKLSIESSFNLVQSIVKILIKVYFFLMS